ncbi:MAG: galactokinase [Planctomycetes bacterium]|nr:galactokinase [Planctomycetota bacterium]
MTGTESQQRLIAAILARFRAEFGAELPAVFFAPGRVNLIGAHLDYNGGDVLPVTVDLGVDVAIRLRDDDRLRLRSLDQTAAVDTRLGELGDTRTTAQGWAAYPLGVVRMLSERLDGRGFDAVFGGDLPMASGMSSSAALEVATAYALDQLCGLALPNRELALVCHAAETRFVGVQCGIMDQFASALGRAGHALWLHCADASFEHVEIHAGFELLVMDTKKPRTLASVAFNERVRECGEALEVLRAHARVLPNLASYGEADLARAAPWLAGVHLKRARHVVSEMQRVARGVAALRVGEIAALGAALSSSHRSTAVDYEVSCAELDTITAAACAQPGVFGARLTGAGFGGCAIALIEPGAAERVVPPVRDGFLRRFGVEPGFRVLAAGGGPRRVA